MNFFKAFTSISFFTLISRILGVVRDILFARFLASGPVADAFFLAFKFPNSFRQIFAEGAFQSAFVPLYAKELEKFGNDQASAFAYDILKFLLYALLPLICLIEIFMPYCLMVIAPGFKTNAEHYQLTIDLARICFPYLMAITFVGFFNSLLNANYKFAAPAATPILLNISLIFALICLIPIFENPGFALAFGVVIAAVVQLSWSIYFCWREQCLPKKGKTDNVGTRKTFFKLFIPAVFASGIIQINILIGSIFATFYPGAVSYLYYGDRLNQLPLAMIGIAIGVTLLPFLSRQLKTGHNEKVIHTLNRGLEFGLLLTIPAALSLIVLAQPMISALFEYGKFNAIDRFHTAQVLMAYAVGLPAYVMIKIFSVNFFAREDTSTPMKIGLVTLFANILGILILTPYLGFVGIALSTALSSWFNMGCQSYLLWKRKAFIPDNLLFIRVGKAILLSMIMGIILWFCLEYLPIFSHMDGYGRITYLALLILGGLSIYIVSVLGFSVYSLNEIRLFVAKEKK